MVDPAFCDELLRLAARGVVRAGLSGPYGHISVRLDERHFRVTRSTALSAIDDRHDGITVDTVSQLPPGVAGEVRLHQRIYAARPETAAIIRFISPKLLSLSAMGLVPVPRHGFGAYFWPRPAFSANLQLVRDDAAADAAFAAMGESCALIMRGNGAVVAGSDVKVALALAVNLEDAARVELDVLHAGRADAPGMTFEEATKRATWEGDVAERLWMHWTS
ncbi:hypothetical protein sphantq_04459 (plasmid) [Sphingobium sp. AntQ-1]|uniref:class II aldolase/adducin family protein n=1 Tax=Sphingobium sp. AntQ-1 TaxID=2930091 RepID=UPI00234EEAF5|nr:class II aldolase/adducin family protein [Sphingobium sp. AntQ-1]WCP15967.1 hypothetical protein sphantq_04459 [Sphingobium sp. AntQ-1]